MQAILLLPPKTKFELHILTIDTSKIAYMQYKTTKLVISTHVSKGAFPVWSEYYIWRI